MGNTDLEILDASDVVVASQPFVSVEDVYHFDFGRNVFARSIKLNRREFGELNIAEVEVFGAFYDPPTKAPSVSAVSYQNFSCEFIEDLLRLR